MKSILVGQMDRVLGRASLMNNGEWLVVPQDGTEDEIRETLDIIFARVQRRRKPLTKAAFVDLFYARRGAPAQAQFATAWANRVMTPEMEAILNRKRPEVAPHLEKVQRIQQELLAGYAERKRA